MDGENSLEITSLQIRQSSCDGTRFALAVCRAVCHLEYMFDHTFLAANDDPHLSLFKEMDEKSIIQLRILPNVGMEGTAKYVYETVNEMIKVRTQGRAWVKLVKVSENENNSAIYSPRKSELGKQ